MASCSNWEDEGGSHWDTYCIYSELIDVVLPDPLSVNHPRGVAFRYQNTYNTTPTLEFSGFLQRSWKPEKPHVSGSFIQMAKEKLHNQIHRIAAKLGGQYPGAEKVIKHLKLAEDKTNSSSCAQLEQLWNELSRMNIQSSWDLSPTDSKSKDEILVRLHAPVWELAYFGTDATVSIRTDDREHPVSLWIEDTIAVLRDCSNLSTNQKLSGLESFQE